MDVLPELLITDARYVLTVDGKRRIIRDGAIAVDGMEIVEVGKSSDLKKRYAGAERIDAKDKLVMPGLFDCHAHSYQNMVRGMAFVLPRRERAGFALGEGLRLWSVYSPEDAAASMELNCLECIKSGIVGFCDWGINLRYGFDGLAEVVERSGVRAVLGKSVMDRPSFGVLENAIPEGLGRTRMPALRTRFGLLRSGTVRRTGVSKCGSVHEVSAHWRSKLTRRLQGWSKSMELESRSTLRKKRRLMLASCIENMGCRRWSS